MTTTKQRIPITDELMKAAQKLVASGYHNWSNDYINEMFKTSAMAKIYFPSIELTVIETSETIDVMTFIGDVGGTLGR